MPSNIAHAKGAQTVIEPQPTHKISFRSDPSPSPREQSSEQFLQNAALLMKEIVTWPNSSPLTEPITNQSGAPTEKRFTSDEEAVLEGELTAPELCRAFKRIRESKGLSLRGAGTHYGVSHNEFVRIENESYNPSRAKISDMADLLGYDVHFTLVSRSICEPD